MSHPSDIKQAIDALFVVLEEERAALRTVDGAAVEKAATRKAELAKTLEAASVPELAPHADSLGRLRAELRRNGVLLAHARACLVQAVELLHPKQGGARRGTLRTSM